MRDSPSAPPAAQALAMAAMSVTFGESFTYTGLWQTAFTRSVTRRTVSGSVPKLMPPSWTFGQLTLTSMRSVCGEASALAQHSANSSREKPLMFAMIGLE